MRAILVIGLLAAPASHAFGDSTVTAVSLMGAGTSHGSDYSVASNEEASWRGGARLTLTFESAPLPIPEPGFYDHDLRIVPELFAGFLADHIKAEGMVGAGLRGELHISSFRHDCPIRTVLYTAARLEVIGGHQDGAAEFAVGSYLLGRDLRRFGWEIGTMLRPTAYLGPDRANELDVLFSMYVAR